ncbi:MAG: hypothetical protein GTO08_00570 [Deltaproteobacteria bacterium]|nr:hypothetical protein [Deltaproteobacteria bacterium]
MEAILYTSQIGVSFTGGLILLLAAIAIVLLGYLSSEEGERGRIFWAEWPLPDSGMSKAVLGKDVPKAA